MSYGPTGAEFVLTLSCPDRPGIVHAVSGFLVVALSLIGVSALYGVFTEVLGYPSAIAPFLMVGFGFGGSDGAVAISALPPLNGFASEWLAFQALLYGFRSSSDPLVHFLFPVAGALLAHRTRFGSYVYALGGNPVSALVTFEVLVRPDAVVDRRREVAPRR